MARLPQPGSDKGTWGDILNDYLIQAHTADGAIKPNSVTSGMIAADAVTSSAIAPNAVTSTELAPNAVTATNIAVGAITPTQLSSGVQASLANADAAVTGTAPDADTNTKGLVKLAGSLSGTAALPTIATGVITDTNISGSAAISQSKVSGLTSALSGKEPTITAGTTSQYLRGDKSFQTLDKTAVGLANVDNTSDLNKPISTATQTALNLKATTASLSTVATSGSYTDLANKPTIPTVPVSSVAGRTGAVTLTSTDVGLANVNNTSDSAKPVSTATQTALNLKANTASLAAIATTGSYNDLLDVPNGSGTVSSVAGRTGAVTLTSSDVGLANVNNTSDANKPISTATQTALSLKANTASLATVATTGTYSDLSGKPTLSTVATTGSYTDLSNTPTIPSIPVTSVAGKTGAVTLTSTDVGLANVNNTSDANKPISTATQTALNSQNPITYGFMPIIYYNTTSSAWPARTVPSGYTGPVTWDSLASTTAGTPVGSMVAGDRWLRRYPS